MDPFGPGASKRWMLSLSIFALSLSYVLTGLAQESVKIIGKVVDDESGQPIKKFMIQAGKRDKEDPEKTTWGYSERNTSSSTGSFTTTVRWNQGWTARIVADGYAPLPVIQRPPKIGQKEIEVEIRLSRGKPMVGKVINHMGDPVDGAKVYTVGARSLNLYDGEARHRYRNGEIDTRAKYVVTDKKGRFKVHVGGAHALAVSAPGIDAWAYPLSPDSKVKKEKDKKDLDSSKVEPVEIKLPKPTSVKVRFDIPDAGEEAEVFYQFLSHLNPAYRRIESTRTFKIKNGETKVLGSLPPGNYQFVRQKMHRYGNVGTGAMIDRTFVELKPGKTTEIDFVRSKGKKIEGVVRLPDDAKLAGVILTVQSVEEMPMLGTKSKMKVTYDSQLLAGAPQKTVTEKEVAFKTELLEPGKYIITVIGYKAMTPRELGFSGIHQPEYRVMTKTLEVTEKGAPNMLILNLISLKKKS